MVEWEAMICIKDRCNRWVDNKCDLGHYGSCYFPKSIKKEEAVDRGILINILELVINKLLEVKP